MPSLSFSDTKILKQLPEHGLGFQRPQQRGKSPRRLFDFIESQFGSQGLLGFLQSLQSLLQMGSVAPVRNEKRSLFVFEVCFEESGRLFFQKTRQGFQAFACFDGYQKAWIVLDIMGDGFLF